LRGTSYLGESGGQGDGGTGGQGDGGLPEPPSAPEPAPEPPTDLPRGNLTANDFWHDFYRLRAEGRLGSQAEKLKSAPEIKAAMQGGDWATAHKWILTQVR